MNAGRGGTQPVVARRAGAGREAGARSAFAGMLLPSGTL